MIDIDMIKADFQIISSRVVKFELETRDWNEEKENISVSNNYDYEIIKLEENEQLYYGVLHFKSYFTAKVKNKLLFKVNIIYEGAFIGKKEKLGMQDFKNMLELNGIVTLAHLTRAYVISCTALAGFNPPVRLPLINIHKLKEMKEQTMTQKQ
ncbi:hypothetical protein Csac_0627 [Caldicellulosiruptor saccharolyticus DSM 8903]|uniref:Preprotein translocase subunit SecB n=1 Tax=Caldicellulosiruptor saccharolyticus (strain ATCC 43494 / DSM 8903 / Tp8T 6331) TaxID=351627 RepID=A4XH65_CALS8|nr:MULTISPECIES: protein-export chaperone SecB [Caldicellulosiruptor]ABP66250.1 hypothetical protein Csac_0627 [Caldicellulosiruptor saccharolyticus DSM 8903]